MDKQLLSCHVFSFKGCSDGDVRLVGGATAQEGRVEFCNNDTWGTVCDDSWDMTDAIVVCRQLGFSVTEVVAFRNAAFGQGTGPILLDNVACSGSESRLADCSHNGIGINNCGHSEDAGVICQATSPTTPSPTAPSPTTPSPTTPSPTTSSPTAPSPTAPSPTPGRLAHNVVDPLFLPTPKCIC